MSEEVYRDQDSMLPLGIGPTSPHTVIVDDNGRHEGWGNTRQEADDAARAAQEAADADDD